MDGDDSRPSHGAETPTVQPAPDRSDTVCPKPQRRGSLLVEALALTAVPIALVAAGLTGFSQTALLSFAVVIAALAVFFTSYEKGGARLREVMPTVVLAALAAAGRILFAAVPSVKPVSAIAIIAGVALGRRSGFMVGALAALVSNFFFGQGPWTPWQMYAWGLVGYGAGALAQTGLFGSEGSGLRSRLGGIALLVYGFISSVAYGWILNAWSVLGFLHTGLGFNLLAVYAASLPFDIAHGVATVVFLAALYVPWRRKLKRILG
ncbi:ECF transporter S component [Collinsella tanakaei]|nr:ECF transporter S component [Collinsella tanakaei]